jgi:hypothetical protein
MLLHIMRRTIMDMRAILDTGVNERTGELRGER